ncbi:MAG: hypothetical protein AMJ53_10630 [Gammaproteobacteria bacterium SG8_11]|nr:MAG: hypothetical protein AMJ53_10630 [Gammaproteobacteria bacterium SG8_11]
MNIKQKRRLLLIFIVALVIIGAYVTYYGAQVVFTVVAYKAKILCSGVFVSKRSPQSVLSVDLAVDDLAPMQYINTVIDTNTQQVKAEFIGIRKTAVYRPGLGCTLLFNGAHHDGKSKVRRQDPQDVLTAWSNQEKTQHFDEEKLSKVLDWAFSEINLDQQRRTRAVVILHEGKVVAERYASGFDKNTPFNGWSMTKSVINALVGILVKQGKLNLQQFAPVAAWQSPNDPRRKITLGHLLHMTSGLQFDEEYGPLSDVTKMLTRVGDTAAFAANKKLVAEPGSHWSYSSGTTNIISRIIRDSVGEDAYWDYPYKVLFGPLGMHSAVIEPDASGTFIGSSFMYATARDWAKFGQLYLQDGEWNGERILPKNWVAYTTTPVSQAPQGIYGSHFWLQLPDVFRSSNKTYALPKDAFHMAGHEGQLITIIPSYKLVIVRLGLTRYPVWEHDKFVSMVLDAMK